MTAKDIILLLLGAVLGAVVNGYYDLVRERVKAMLLRRRSQTNVIELNSISEVAQAVRLLTERGAAHHLSATATFSRNLTLPLLPDPNFGPVRLIDLHDDNVVSIYDSTTTNERPANMRKIRKAIRRGSRIFDGPILALRRSCPASEDVGGSRFELEVTNYFSYATLVLQLRSEIKSKRWRRTPALNNMASYSVATDGRIAPQAIGCAAVSVFKDALGDLYVGVAKRSSSVVIGAGLRSVIPAFGVEPNVSGGSTSEWGVFAYNYMREVLEEFFDLEDTVDSLKSRRSHPDWLFDLPPARPLVGEAESGGLRLYSLGAAVNCRDGSLCLPVLALFTSSAYYELFCRTVRANWESGTGSIKETPIQFVRLFGPELDKWVTSGSMEPISAYALDLARGYLSSERAGSQMNRE